MIVLGSRSVYRVRLANAIWATLLLIVGSADMVFAQEARDAARDADPKFAGIGWEARGKHGAVAAGGAGAVAAGMSILQKGGNAADAAAATILALSVTDHRSFCFGGEVPILAYNAARGTTEVLAGQGAAPRLATRERFLKEGGIPATGVLPATVPAVVDAVVVLLERQGTMDFSTVVQPTMELLQNGKLPWHADLTKTLQKLIDAEKQARTLKAEGKRAAGLRAVSDRFYRGDIAAQLAKWSEEHGGLIRLPDLAFHHTWIEAPATLRYRDWTLIKCGPWTQGPALLQALQLLEGFDLKTRGPLDPHTFHLEIEALKLAFADRDAYYADPGVVPVPLQALLNPDYAKIRRTLISRDRASVVWQPGDPERNLALRTSPVPGIPQELGTPGKDTTTCVTADAAGNIIAATPSGWDGVVAGDTGVWLGSRLQSFNTWEGHPNVIQPNKRPRITLTPTLILKNDRPVAAISVAGGDGQDQETLQMVIQYLEYARDPSSIVVSPRFLTDHHIGSFRQTPPKLGAVRLSNDTPKELQDGLKTLGHTITLAKPPLSVAPVMISIDPDGTIHAAGDPRAGRHAAAY